MLVDGGNQRIGIDDTAPTTRGGSNSGDGSLYLFLVRPGPGGRISGRIHSEFKKLPSGVDHHRILS